MTEKFKRAYYQDNKDLIVAILDSAPGREFSTHALERIVFAAAEPGKRTGAVPNMLTDLAKTEGRIVRIRSGWYRAAKPEPEKDQETLDFEVQKKRNLKIVDFNAQIDDIKGVFLKDLNRIIEDAKGRVQIATSMASELSPDASPISESADQDISRPSSPLESTLRNNIAQL